ncbi:hypothetical protein J6U78_00090 [bacterium]|nr:hypothetical protein [bacterium]
MKYTALVSVFAFACVSLFAEDVSVKPAGEGTEKSPYLFDCLENFFWLRQQTKEMDPNVPVYCRQIKDIDASATQQGGDYAWSDIDFSKNNLFAYDGQCYTIFGLEPEEKGALFGTGYFQLKNIRIQGAEGKKTCALAKCLHSSNNKTGFFENCHIRGLLVKTPALVGTVAGNDVRIENCVVEAEIDEGEIVEGEPRSYGALMTTLHLRGGKNIIKNTCFKGKVKVKPETLVSGLTLILSLGTTYYNAEVTIEDCYTDFIVECDPDDRHSVVGLIGAAFLDYNTNTVLNIERCYTACEASESIVYSAAFIYQLTNTVNTLNIKDCYYREAPNFTDDLAIAKTDEEMKRQATFENWDFENVWDIDEDEGMPYLRCEVPEPFGMFALLLLPLLRRRANFCSN